MYSSIKLNMAVFAGVIGVLEFGITGNRALLFVGLFFVGISAFITLLILPTHHSITLQEQTIYREFHTVVSASGYLITMVALALPAVNPQINLVPFDVSALESAVLIWVTLSGYWIVLAVGNDGETIHWMRISTAGLFVINSLVAGLLYSQLA
jgi:hypothetical protein